MESEHRKNHRLRKINDKNKNSKWISRYSDDLDIIDYNFYTKIINDEISILEEDDVLIDSTSWMSFS